MAIDQTFIENYLENYPKTHSDQMDPYFSLTKADVYRMAIDYRNGEVYIYNKKDFLDFLSNSIADFISLGEDEDSIDELKERLEGTKALPFDVVANTVDDNDYFIW